MINFISILQKQINAIKIFIYFILCFFLVSFQQKNEDIIKKNYFDVAKNKYSFLEYGNIPFHWDGAKQDTTKKANHESHEQPSNCIASPYPVTLKQPDGTTITILGKGDNRNSHTETVDGYTIVLKNGIYEYAKKKNGKLVPSGIKARDEKNRTSKEKNLLKATPKNLQEASISSFNGVGSNKAIQSVAPTQLPNGTFPAIGTRKTLLLLIQYPDKLATYSKATFNNFMNQVNYNGTGSFRDFYLAASYGKLDVNTDVFGWYTATQNYAYYGKQNGYARSTQLVREAVDAAEAAGVDFSQYDNDGDGTVDGVIVAHAGQGAEEGSQLQYVWSHRWVLAGGGNSVTYDGKLIDDYIINPETKVSGVAGINGIGVFCHEFGHNLGLPDLYDINNVSQGIGNWCLMAGAAYLGDAKQPGNFSAWCKTSLGWLKPKLITAAGNYTLNTASTNAECYQVNTQLSNEYFLIENRQKNGKDAALPGSGLAIWHINTDKTSLTNNTVNATAALPGVYLEQADGLKHLDLVGNNNRGDAGDLYPGSANNTTFNNTSNPNSKTYTNVASSIALTNIAINGSGVGSFTFANPNIVATSITQQPSTASQTLCLGAAATALNITASAGVGQLQYQWYKNAANSTNGGIAISGATTNTCTPITNLSGTSYYYATITSNITKLKVFSAVSGAINVNPNQPIGTIGGTMTVCVNSTTALTAPSLPTGGTITTSGKYRIHTFTSSGSFITPVGFFGLVEHLIVGGGGSGGINGGGGGGAGGVISGFSTLSSNTSYPVTVGAGGGGNGGNSDFRGFYTAIGGGVGATRNFNIQLASSGGSGGGGAASNVTQASYSGDGTSGQGNAGGNGTDPDLGCDAAGGGGGGAGSVGADAVSQVGGNGGSGITSSISGTTSFYAAGGGGTRPCYNSTLGIGGSGIGGNGGGVTTAPTNGVANTGSGGGGGGALGSGSGGSGIVILRYVDYSQGTWSSSDPSVAIVDASTGVVTGVAAGTATISLQNSICSGASTTTVTVYARPIITFTSQPSASVCTGTDLTYTTQSGQSSYTWSIPGVLNTNYSITSGGTTSSSSVTLKWLTAGNKTVSVNYSNINGCRASVSATSNAITVNSANTITLSSAAGTNNQIKNINTAIINITYNTVGATGATFSGLPTGVTGVWASNMVTISGTPSVAGNYNYTISLTGGCGVASASGSINVNVSVPIIAYTTPQNYPIGQAITPLTPINTGGAVPANIYGQVSTFAGSGTAGALNATGVAASFNYPFGVATDADGNVYVADQYNQKIRKITPLGDVTTFAGNGTANVVNANTALAASFYYPAGVAINAAGDVYIAEPYSNRVRKITAAGVVSTLAGSGATGAIDATGVAASFNTPTAIAVDASGNVYVADQDNHKIRKITAAGVVTTLAGSGSSGAVDATGIAASFNRPSGIALDANGIIYVADQENHKIRKITGTGVVTTLAGSGTAGSLDGTGISANFYYPLGLTVDIANNVFVTENYTNTIRKITSTGIVTTFAGTLGISGSFDAVGTNASFYQPSGIAVDALGNAYIADRFNHIIRKIILTGYTISPDLPSGLSFNSGTGTISGTPTVATPATNYTVVGYNVGGSGTSTVNIATTNNSNANLSALTTTAGILTPVFAPSTTAYVANVSNTTTSVTVTPTKADANATLQVRINTGSFTTVASGNASTSLLLNVGTNTIDVRVKAQDGTTFKTYTITVTRVCTNTSSTTNLSICPSALPYSWNGLTFTAAGSQTKTGLVNSQGCDSTATLNLSITKQYVLNEDFSNVIFPPIGWSIGSAQTTDGSASSVWNKSTTSGTAESGHAFCNFYLWGNVGVKDSLVSPIFTATGSNDNLNFDYAYRTYLNEVDQLNIYTSINGGGTWSLLQNLQGGPNVGTGMVTATPSQSIYLLPATNEWSSKLYLVPTGTNRVKFEVVTAYGNNLFLDNIKVTGSSTSINNIIICPSQVPYSWNGLTFTASGSQTKTGLVNSQGCDSSATLNLTVKTNTSSTTNLSICPSALPYSWNGLTFTVSGSQTKIGLVNSQGCDSSATLNLTVKSLPNAGVISGGSSFCYSGGSTILTSNGDAGGVWTSSNSSRVSVTSGGVVTASVGGNYTIYYTVTNTCSTAVASKEIIVNVPSNHILFQTACDSYTWVGTTYTTSGIYTITGLTNSNGCDSTSKLNLTINKSTTSIQNLSICPSALPYSWNGLIFTAAGSQTKTGLVNSQGCDSSATLILKLKSISTSTTNLIVCDSAVWNGKTYKSTGGYPFISTNAIGCDSIATLNLIVKKSTSSTQSISICPSALPYSWNGLTFTAAGSKTKTGLLNSQACDSSATLNLTVKTNTSSIQSISICPSALPYNWNGLTFTVAGSQTKTGLLNSQGCDSSATLNLSVKTNTSSITNLSVCPSALPYNWNGLTFTVAGSQTKTGLVNSQGCDSSATLNLSLKTNTSSTQNLSICPSALPYSWNGLTFTAAGSQTKTGLVNSQGCDSSATLNLSLKTNTSSMQSISICPSALPYSWNGLTFTAAGSQTKTGLLNSQGCDSSATLNLTVKTNTSSTQNFSICPSALPYSWNGLTFTAAGSQTKTGLVNSQGCDSSATLNLSLKTNTSSTQSISICPSSLPYSWNGLTFTAAGSKTKTGLLNSQGCDSSATLNLTVKTNTSSTQSLSICPSQLPYSWNGLTFTIAGSQTKTGLVNSQGCDSSATLNLTVKTNTSSTQNLSICPSALPYSWNGLTFTVAGSQTKTGLVNSQGCDSSATLNLTVKTNTSSTQNLSICPSALPYSWNGLTFTVAGSQTKTGLINSQGCDSSATLNLSLKTNTSSTQNLSICPSALPYNWNGLSFTAAGSQTKTGLTNSQGCDSSATLNLSVKTNTSSTTNLSICPSSLPYSWNGLTFTTAGSQTKTGLLNSQGCDSSATLNLTVKTNTSSTQNIAICPSQLPYSWNGLSFTTAGSQTKTGLLNSQGCDSSATLNLSVKTNTSSITNLSVCPSQLPYSWNGLTFTAAGSQTKTGLTNSQGCDSSATLNLTVKTNTSSTQSLSICPSSLPYSWNGLIFTVADSQTKTGLVNSQGCDSSATLNLTVKINTPSIQSISICPSSLPYSWNGLIFTAAGSQTKTGLLNSQGCDSSATLNLSVKTNTSSITNLSVCPSALPYNWNGLTYTATSSQTKTGLTNSQGCDSTATLNLTVKTNTSSTQSIAICPSQLPYSWNGLSFTAAGSQTKTGLVNSQGCDSSATLNLTVKTNTSSLQSISICPSALPYSWNGLTFTAAGSQTKNGLINSQGCDSSATLNLTVKTNTSSIQSISICPSALPYSWNGLTFTVAGSQTKTGLVNSQGCDSSATLNLTVKTNTSSTQNLSICPSALPYSWNGLTFTVAGSQTKTDLVNSQGCDSSATLNLTVKTNTSSIQSISICPSALPYSWNGLTFTVAGSQTKTGLVNSQGCDSSATLNLTVKTNTSSTQNLSICPSALPYSWNGLTFTVAGSQTKTGLINSQGCDSSATLNLSLKTNTSSTQSLSICPSLLPYSWNGLTFTAAGSQTKIGLVNSQGCDSSATLNLSVKTNTSSTQSLSICPSQLPYSWNGLTFTIAGSQTKTGLVNSQGCDSSATLNLSLKTNTSSTQSIAICPSQLPYSWNGLTFTVASSQTKTGLVNSQGCDSSATLNLSVKTNTSSNTNLSICPSSFPYSWNGLIFTAAGSQTKTGLVNSQGCDSSATLNLTAKTNTSSTQSISICLSQLPYSWNGLTFTAAGSQTKNGLINSQGCDSSATLNLSVKTNTSSTQSSSICPSQLPYSWNGLTFTVAGSQTKTGLTNSQGCDSSATLNLTVKTNTSSTQNLSICPSALPYSWNGLTFTAAGSQTKTGLVNSQGCDSSATLNLTVKTNTSSTQSLSICPSQFPYSWNGLTFTVAGSQTKTDLVNSQGCDSSATLNLTVKTNTSSTQSISICPSALPYSWNGLSFTVAGSQTKTGLVNSQGCDSSATLNLTVKTNTSSTQTLSICPSQLPYSWNGLTFTVAGSQTKTGLVNSQGCDSSATLNLVVVQSLLPTITTVTSTPNICFGNIVVFSVITNNQGASPMFHWFKNGIAVGMNSNTYTDSLLNNQDSIWCVLTSSEICVSNNNIKSNIISMNVSLAIAGSIKTPIGNLISNVTLYRAGSLNDVQTVSKKYLSTCIDFNNNIKLSLFKNNDINKANGINATDVLFTQRHILNTTKLNSAYKLIAADVNGDKAINATDILRIKRLILGTDTTFTSATKGNRLWEFVDSAYIFPDTTNPFPFKDSISFTNLTSNKINQTFIGVKLGDVNYDWNPTVAKGVEVKPLELVYHVISTKEKSNQTDFSGTNLRNDEIRVKVTANNFKDIVALQYTLHFDNSKYEFIGIENNNLNIDFNSKQASENGNITMLWTDKNAVEETLNDGTELFTLVLQSTNYRLPTADLKLLITNNITEVAAWDKDFTEHSIILSKQKTINDKPETINEWTIYPNPTKRFVNLYVETLIGKGNIVIADVYGKQVKTQSLSMGNNTIDVAKLSKGIYFVSILTSEGKTTKKLVVE